MTVDMLMAGKGYKSELVTLKAISMYASFITLVVYFYTHVPDKIHCPLPYRALISRQDPGACRKAVSGPPSRFHGGALRRVTPAETLLRGRAG